MILMDEIEDDKWKKKSLVLLTMLYQYLPATWYSPSFFK
jgi:hypothetical protein